MRISPRPAKHPRRRSTAAPRAIPVTRSAAHPQADRRRLRLLSRQRRSCARQGTAEQRVSASCSRLPQPRTISCESRSYWQRPFRVARMQPRSNAANCADVSRITPSVTGGHLNAPLICEPISSNRSTSDKSSAPPQGAVKTPLSASSVSAASSSLDRWAIGLLLEAGAIHKCGHLGWARDRADPMPGTGAAVASFQKMNLTPTIFARRQTTSQTRCCPPSEKASSKQSGTADGTMTFAPCLEISRTWHSQCARPSTLIQADR